MSSALPAPPLHRASRSLPTADAIPAALFLARTRSHDPFLRSEAREQDLYRGETVNRMSIFGFTSSMPLDPVPPPPKYSSTRHQPPPYKAPLDVQQSPLGSHPLPPPPVYQRARAGTAPSRNPGRERSQRLGMSEPPEYSGQEGREGDAKRQVLETGAEDADTEWATSGARAIAKQAADRRRRKKEEEEEEDDDDEGSSWCCWCFWVGPAKLPWQAYVVF